MDNRHNIVNLKTYQASCTNCNLKDFCLASHLDVMELEQFEKIVERSQPLQRGQHLYRQSDQFHNIYIVKSGSIKNYITMQDGAEYIFGFYLPGELLALDSIAKGEHASSAIAQETTYICKILYPSFEQLCHQIPHLQEKLFQIAASKIASAHDWQLLLAQRNSEKRFAVFLLNQSDRIGKNGYSKNVFYLSMARQDIANYLGLACETISRLFTRFNNEGILQVKKKLIHIRDQKRLMAIASPTGLYPVQTAYRSELNSEN